ncbi:MAG: RAMP superfamily CRISPR-associated protein, partial [Tannerellaceae bacterium]
MQTDIKYKIEFFTDWHCSSGLAAGSDVDLLVIKDRNNLPYVPGKTIKGLVKEAIEELILCKACYVNDNTLESLKNTVLGAGTNEQQRKDKYNNIPIKGTSYFTNAELSAS